MLRNDILAKNVLAPKTCRVCGKINHNPNTIHPTEQFRVLLVFFLYVVAVPCSVIALISPFFVFLMFYVEVSWYMSFVVVTFGASFFSSAILFYMESKRTESALFWHQWIVLTVLFSPFAFVLFWPKLFLQSIQLARIEYSIRKVQMGLASCALYR